MRFPSCVLNIAYLINRFKQIRKLLSFYYPGIFDYSVSRSVASVSGTYSKRSPGWQFNASHNAAIESVVIRFPARRCISVSRRNATTVNQQWWLSPVLYMEVWQQRRKEN